MSEWRLPELTPCTAVYLVVPGSHSLASRVGGCLYPVRCTPVLSRTTDGCPWLSPSPPCMPSCGWSLQIAKIKTYVKGTERPCKRFLRLYVYFRKRKYFQLPSCQVAPIWTLRQSTTLTRQASDPYYYNYSNTFKIFSLTFQLGIWPVTGSVPSQSYHTALCCICTSRTAATCSCHHGKDPWIWLPGTTTHRSWIPQPGQWTTHRSSRSGNLQFSII